MLNDTLNKISRLMYILNEFDRGEVFLPDIAENLSVTLRTIQRDLRVLEDAGFPFANTKKGAYCFVEVFSLQRMRLTAKEAAMLAIIADISKSLGGSFYETYRQLHSKVTESHEFNPFYIKMTKGQTLKDSLKMKTLENAIKLNHKAELDYGESKITGRALSPLKIVWFNGFWYLLAYGKGETILKLRLDKIKSAKILDETFTRPAKIEKILEDSSSIWFEENRTVNVCLKVDGETAIYFKQRQYFPKQKNLKTEKDGSLVIECSVGKFEEILPTILEWIPHITVQSPQELKDTVAQKIAAYQKLINK